MLVVSKFGGTSVSNANAFKQVAKIIQNNNKIKIVVLSAIAKITNKLIKLSKLTFVQRKYLCQDIVKIHKNIIEQLELNNDIFKILNPIIKELFSISETTIIACDLDHLLSIGERLSTAILTELLKKNNIKAFLIDARKLIITNDNFGQAIPISNAIKSRCISKIKPKIKDHIVITQGFIGATKKGCTTTLGRGGSDYTAALLAEALDANLLEIYTDVKGVHTGDPNLIPNARLITNINYADMLKLSKFGAKILHPDTIIPCVRKNIPISIKSTFCKKTAGTLIKNTKNISHISNSIQAIALKRNQTLITIKRPKKIILDILDKLFKHYKAKIEFFIKKKKSINIILETINLYELHASSYTKQKCFKKKNLMTAINIEKDLALLTLITENKIQTLGSLQKFIISLNLPTQIIYFKTKTSNLSLLIKDEYAQSLMEHLHKKFFE